MGDGSKNRKAISDDGGANYPHHTSERANIPPTTKDSDYTERFGRPRLTPRLTRASFHLMKVKFRTPAASRLICEANLVQAAVNGDAESFAALYKQFAPFVHGILAARVPRSELDDLVQDTFFQAFAKISTLRDGRVFGPWIATIARYKAIEFYRRTPKTTPMPEDIAYTSLNFSFNQEVFERITSLPLAYRETLMLRLIEGMTGPEIAARTGLTPASVRVNLHRGMKLLRESLERNRQALAA